MALGLDLHHLVDGVDQVLVGLDQGFDIDDSALGFLCRLDGADLQRFGVLLQQVVCHVGHRSLGLEGFLGVMHAQGQHHLALPKGQGVGKGGLDPFHQQAVVVLEQPDLRRHLDGNLAGQLQVMQLLLKPVALGGEVVRLLGVHRVPAGFGLGLQRFQIVFADLGELLVSRDDVEGQLVEVVVVLVVQAVEHGDVLEQLRLVSFQGIGDVLNIHGHLVVPCLHPGDLVLCFGEDLRQTLRLLGILLEAFQLGNEVHQHVADLTGILRLDSVQGGL